MNEFGQNLADLYLERAQKLDCTNDGIGKPKRAMILSAAVGDGPLVSSANRQSLGLYSSTVRLIVNGKRGVSPNADTELTANWERLGANPAEFV